jgi:DNA-binding response OmpR family regulator
MQPKQLNILLVDDDEDEGMILSEALTEIDSHIKLKQINSWQSLSTEEAEPDIVFVDINMPRVNGYQWVKNIRCTGYNFPIVMYSTAGSEEQIARALNSGANYYYRKQGDFNSLINVVREILFNGDLRQVY